MANKKVVKKTNTKNKPSKETKKVEVKKETKKVVEKKETKEIKKDRGLLFAIIGIVAVVVAAIVCFIVPTNEKTTEEDKVLAVMTIKDYGDIMLELDRTQAPETVDNFLELANSGFYDGLSFHRIIKGFMMQGGDPDGDGYGGSDKSIKGEFETNGVKNSISHVRGTISMARGDDPDSASSQFFIVQDDSTNLDGYYAGFGKVTSGMDIVDKIIDDFGTEDDMTLPNDKRPIITSIREVEMAETEIKD